MNREARALIVARESAERKSLKGLLQGRGFQVWTVEGRSQGYDLLDGLPFELLVLEEVPPLKGPCYRVVWLQEAGRADSRLELSGLSLDALSEELEQPKPPSLAAG